MIAEILIGTGIYFLLKKAPPGAAPSNGVSKALGPTAPAVSGIGSTAVIPTVSRGRSVGADVDGTDYLLYAAGRLAVPVVKAGIEAITGETISETLGLDFSMTGVPEGYLPGTMEGTLELGQLGLMGLSGVTTYLGAKTGTPIPGAMANLVTPVITGVVNPLGIMTQGIGSSMETGRVTTGIVSTIQSVLGVIPFLGGVLSGMLSGAFGKTPESPYQYYDPATRSIATGTQLGEPLDQFDSAAKQYQAMISGIEDMLAKQYATQYGFDPSNLYDWRYGPEIYSELGVPIPGNLIGQYYKPGVMDYVYTEEKKAGGIESFFNPTERWIATNYNALFNQPADPILSGPSPYMVYLASQGR